MMSSTSGPSSSTPYTPFDWVPFYVSMGLRVLPLWGVTFGPGAHNTCMCGNSKCGSPGKHPIGSLVPHGLRDATVDLKILGDWWKQHPEANIGIATSASFAILDIDKKNDGLTTFERLKQSYGPDLFKSPYRVLTGGGGLHLAVRVPPGTRSRAGLDVGIDLRAENGYAVAPPSRHILGTLYFAQPQFERFDFSSLLELPAALLPQAMGPNSSAATAQVSTSSGKIRQGQRNDALTSLVGTLRRWGVDGAAIESTVKTVNSQLFDPPISDAELHATVASIAKKAPATLPAISFQGADEIIRAAPPDVPWVIPGMLAEGVVTELVSPPKAGKTTLVRGMLSSILYGTAFLGLVVKQAAAVLLTEEHTTSLNRGLGRHGINTPNLRVLQRGNVRSSSWPDVVAAAVDEAKRIGARVLVVDTLPAWSLGDCDENSASDAVNAMRPLSEAAATGLAVVVVRHQRKSGGDVVSAGRGSSAFAGESDIVFTLQPFGARPTVRQLESKSRFEETPTKLVVEWTPTGFVSHGDGQKLAQDAFHATVISLLPTSEQAAADIEGILALLAGTPHAVKRTKLKEALDELLKKKVIKQTGAGAKQNRWRYWIDAAVTP